MAHRILVVDDYVEAAEVACMLFDLLGHDCRCAHTGREALAQAGSFWPDIVIMDIGLPDVSGYDVGRELRTRLPGHVYMVALTGRSDQEDVKATLAAGFDEHLVKPADERKLRSVLEHAEQRSQPHAV